MIHVFGIRHHGPGSAWSLRTALEGLRPDVILVEGPPDAAGVLPLLMEPDMVFPVAILIYAPDNPRQSVFYPFAEFSPETVALRWAMENGVPARFMDLPVTHVLAEEERRLTEKMEAAKREAERIEAEKAAAEAAESVSEAEVAPLETHADEPAPAEPKAFNPRLDPLLWMAQAAGYEDGERWWEDLVEHRSDGTELFAAILEAMTALRSQLDQEFPVEGDREMSESQREAWMRITIRAAEREGFQKIAVVCGAWHAPALAGTLPGLPAAKADAALVKGLPKTKVAVTWVPWTNERLSFASGYGAGIESPGWYEHVWGTRENVSEAWMARVAALFREEDIDVSSAHLIESVRLAETLAAFRGRSKPGLLELTEAAQTVVCFGDHVPLRLIHRKLIVGERLGEVPASAPVPPLQQDLAKEQKRLRFPAEAVQKLLDLDLRKPNDLDRSRLLHRLTLLGVGWGGREKSMGKGTFHEIWRVAWKPEFAISLIEAGRWGNTLVVAATEKARNLASETDQLPVLTRLLDQVLLADLPDATPAVVGRIEVAAAIASDVALLMGALPPLVNVLRYGDVRGTRASSVAHIVDELVARLCINLPPACLGVSDEAAEALRPLLDQVNSAIALLQNAEQSAEWSAALGQLTQNENVQGLLAGRATRLLQDSGVLDADEAVRLLGLSLSPAAVPARAVAWIEGYLGGSALLLIHDERLWAGIDRWVSSLTTENFDQLLPFLRRTFSAFSVAERRQLGERARTTESGFVLAGGEALVTLNAERAALPLPLLRLIFGGPAETGASPVTVEIEEVVATS